MSKKAKNKPKKQDDFKPAFKGCVIIPMTDDDFDEQRIRYYGDWENPRKQHQIMKKPRKYQANFYFKGLRGERGVEQIRLVQKDDFKALSHYITKEGNAMVDEIGKERVDLKASYVSIKA